MKNCTACFGCRDNFYNGNNALGVKQCWSVPKAKVIVRYRIGTNVPMNIREAYLKVHKPDCYHESGYAFLPSIPHYAKTKAGRDLEARRDARRSPFTSAPATSALGDGVSLQPQAAAAAEEIFP